MNNPAIRFEPNSAKNIAEHLQSAFPNEGCGFFFGKDGDTRKVSIVLAVKNVKDGDKRRRFEIDPLDFVKAERFALDGGLDLLGIYHSHPNHPAIPSEHDRSQALPYFSYLIVSVINGHVDKATSWRLNDITREFEQETLIDHYNFIKETANV